MPGRRKKKTLSHARSSAKRSGPHAFYTPFYDLDQQLTKGSHPPGKDFAHAPPQTASVPPTKAREEEECLFLQAMSGVTPLDRQDRERVPPPHPTQSPPRFLSLEEEEVQNHLLRLVEGELEFEISHSDEYIDGAVTGLSPRVLKKLRQGEFSYQDHLDLHRMTRAEAREVATRFIMESFARGCRCVLIVCGRGLNSQDKEPVLKQSLVIWLTQAPMKRVVLAFASARSYDGGAGAFYVLLRRNQGKVCFSVPAR